MFYAGFDSLVFPGLTSMASLKAHSNLTWCGYYLAPAPARKTSPWRGQRAGLLALGWGLMPIFVGRQTQGPGPRVSSNLAAARAQGAADGTAATALMKREGFEPGWHCALDLENGKPFPAHQQAYVQAWCHAVESGIDTRYKAAVYCSGSFGPVVARLVPTARIWAFRVKTTRPHAVGGSTFPTPAPAGSGTPTAFAWQRDDEAIIHVAGKRYQLDLDVALSPNPGI